MTTANEVLEQMEQHPELYTSADVCIVDPVTRTISVPDAYRILGVESDESVKVVPFQCPKMVEDDVDLTDFTLYINYVNAGGDFDIYSIENVKESGENITFDWIIRRSVTARRGTIRFILCAKRSDDEGNIIQEWNTTINDECESLEGLEGAPSIADQFPDIIQQILEKLQEITGGGGGTGGPVDQEQIQQAVNDYLTKNPPSGMTTEQQEQLTKNTNDITDLKSALGIISDGKNVYLHSIDGTRYILRVTDDGELYTEIAISYTTATSADLQGINSTNYLLQAYIGSAVDVLIPDTINDKKVEFSGSSNPTFDKNAVIENLSFIEDGNYGGGKISIVNSPVKTIKNIPDLTGINISNCDNLEVVDFAKCISAEDISVLNCDSLVEIKGLKNTVVKSFQQSFLGNTKLKKIDGIPAVTTNTKLMFWNCENLIEAPVIDMELTNWDGMFNGCTSLTEVTVEAMTGCSVTLIAYNVSNGSGWAGGKFTFKCNYGSDMYSSFRSMICDSIGSSEKLFIETLDSSDNPITNVVMWGDSMTKAGNKIMGNVPDQLSTLISDDVMIWNYGYSGNTIASCGTRFKNHPEKWGEVSVIWLGTNNSNYSGEQMVSEIEETFINNLTTDKYIVVGLLTTNYSDEKNQAFVDGFGDHFLNIREYFLENMWTVSGLSATEDDNADLGSGMIPRSFRVDQTHLNPTGGKIVATAIKEKLELMGYII